MEINFSRGGRGIGGVDYAPISRLKRPRRVPVGPTWSPLSIRGIRSLGIGRFDGGAIEVVADLDNDIGLIADPFKNSEEEGKFTGQIY